MQAEASRPLPNHERGNLSGHTRWLVERSGGSREQRRIPAVGGKNTVFVAVLTLRQLAGTDSRVVHFTRPGDTMRMGAALIRMDELAVDRTYRVTNEQQVACGPELRCEQECGKHRRAVPPSSLSAAPVAGGRHPIPRMKPEMHRRGRVGSQVGGCALAGAGRVQGVLTATPRLRLSGHWRCGSTAQQGNVAPYQGSAASNPRQRLEKSAHLLTQLRVVPSFAPEP